jgi:SNF2 family DNA or RNA helicase
MPATVTHEFEKNARLDTLKDLLETLLEDPANKVIIWAYYAAELNHITGLLKSLKVEFARVQGGMSAKNLQAQKDTFNNDATCRVYVAQVSTGIGITLNAANYVVYYSLPWSLEHYLQSLDRNYRIGQSRNVTVYRLIGHHTIDEAKIAALDQKIDFSNLITNRTPCVTCKEFAKRCAPNNIDLYDEACIYDRTMDRNKADIKVIS